VTLPEGWTAGRLGAICSIEIGGTPARDIPEYWDPARDTDNAWVSIRDMRRRVINETAEQISDAGIKHSNVKLQPPGTVLLSFKLTIGRVAVAGVPLYTNEAIAGLKPRGLLAEYLYQGLQHWDLLQGADQAIKGATLNREKLKRIAFEYPRAEAEQGKIAEILSTVDRAIEQTETLIAKQQRIKTGLMQDLFTYGIDKHGNLRSERTHEFKDTRLGRVPVEWEIESFGAACERVSVGIATSTTKYFRQDGVPLLRNQNILDGSLDLADLLYISREFDEANKSKRLRAGDLVTMRTGYPGRTAVVPGAMHGWQTFTTLISTPRKQRYLPEFLCLQINSSVGRKQIMTLQGGGAQQNLNVGWVVNMQVLRPPMEEQERDVACLTTLDHALSVVVQQLTKLYSIRTALIQDLLTGDRRVTALLTQRTVAGE
jgi:type I restriction enzyme S subunit